VAVLGACTATPGADPLPLTLLSFTDDTHDADGIFQCRAYPDHSAPGATFTTESNVGSAALAVQDGTSRSGPSRNLSFPRQDLVDQLIICWLERIDEPHALQLEAILEIFAKQIADAGPLCRCP